MPFIAIPLSQVYFLSEKINDLGVAKLEKVAVRCL